MAEAAHRNSGWDAFHEGMRFTWQFSVSAEDMERFAALSGDRNPLHTDAPFARRKGFEKPVVYGALLAAQVSRLIGQELPSRDCMLTGLRLDFMEPAFPGETLSFEAMLANKSDAVRALKFKCAITRGTGTICRGTADAIWRQDV